MLPNDIANLSTGKYYERPETWYEQLKVVLINYQCKPGPMPDIHTPQGQALIKYTGREKGQIFITWYQMTSKNWEIICYKC